MKNSNIALITALYDTKGADFYKEIYFPIIKYSVTKSVLDAKDNVKYGDISGLKELILDTFGVNIPLLVLRQSIKAMAKQNGDVIIKLFDKDNYYQAERVWSTDVKNDIDIKASQVKESFHNLTIQFDYFMDARGLTSEKSIVDLLTACSADTISLIENGSSTNVSEEYSNIAIFSQWLKEYNNESYILVEQILWASIITGFLRRSSVDWDVKVEDKTTYFLDTSLILNILGFNSIENVNYSRDLLRIIKEAGSYPKIHPMTANEVDHILQSVLNEQGPRGGSAMEYAFVAGIELHDVLHVKQELLGILELDYGITQFPNMSASDVEAKEKKYLGNLKVKELYELRESKGNDMYGEVHDVYMSDYVKGLNSSHGFAEKYSYYFVTLNGGLVDFVRPTGCAPSVISAGQVVMNLWLHSAKSSALRSTVLADMISRCFALNQTSVRRKLRAFSSHYKKLNLSNSEYGAMYDALVYRSNDTLQKMDELSEKEIEFGGPNEDTTSLAKAIVEIALKEAEKRKSLEQNESIRNKELSEQIDQLTIELDKVKQQGVSSQEEIDKLSKALNITEESKDKIKAELERRNKEVDLVRQMSEVEKDISKLETEATNSISYFKFWINVVLESLFLIIIVAIIVLYIISQFNPNFDFAIWFKSLGAAIIVPFLTTCTHMKNLYIFAPRVAKNEIRKKQLETWYDRHAEYKQLAARRMTLEKALEGVSSL